MGLAYIVGVVLGGLFGGWLMQERLTIKHYKEGVEENRKIQGYLNDQYTYGFNNGYDRALRDLSEPRGEWIKAECSEKDGDANCSICGHWDWSDCKFCSECGAKMKISKEKKND